MMHKLAYASKAKLSRMDKKDLVKAIIELRKIANAQDWAVSIMPQTEGCRGWFDIDNCTDMRQVGILQAFRYFSWLFLQMDIGNETEQRRYTELKKLFHKQPPR